MPDLVGRVTAALRDTSDSPWFPGLATELADRGWEDLYHDTGLTPSEYGTERVLARDRNAPRHIVSVIPAALICRDSAQGFQIELLGGDTARRYKESGVKFYSEDEINRERMTERVVEAVTILKSIPTLLTAVAELVRSIHLIDAGEDDYDVSFSEPHVPFSIFVSVPKASSIINALRLAEAIVHEAMHLQLTLIEQTLPLVIESGLQYLSPWRQEFRASSGMLHALYVFRVIDAFLLRLLDRESSVEDSFNYIRDRRNQIARQIYEIIPFRQCPDLTPLGTTFVSRLLDLYCVKS
jgi:HEXXH motif-containing protein